MNPDFKTIFQNIRSITIATVNEDGSPWVTPLLCEFTETTCSWRSPEDAIHSQNIARDPRVAISGWYEDQETQVFEAVYIATSARMVGDAVYSEKYGKDTVQYEAPIGAFDTKHSTENRYYFRSQEKAV